MDFRLTDSPLSSISWLWTSSYVGVQVLVLKEQRCLEVVDGGGAGVDHSQSLFYFVPQEKNITAKLARLGQVWGGKRYIEGQAGGGGFGKT